MPILTICPFCERQFEPSQYNPEQKICSSRQCQQKRRREYHRKKLLQDPAYFEQCQESKKKWRENNKIRLRQYQQQRRAAIATAATDTDQTRRERLMDLLESSAVFDLRRYETELWLLCSSEREDVEKILARAKLIVLKADLSCSLLEP
jgi:hypothetical protein